MAAELPQHNDTIVALATAPGIGAIAVVRLSGPSSIEITDRVFKAASKQPLSVAKGHTAHFGVIMDGPLVLDEVLATVFRGPKSYTGQDVVEISCHGSSYVQQKLMEVLILQGARLARPGEYTMRAFLNGRMALTRAEAVGDLIASETSAQHLMAMNQMRGGYTETLQALRQELIDFVALIELELDFSEEDVVFADRAKLLALLDSTNAQVLRLLHSFRDGNAIRSGVPIVIAGRPNVGKSTLLNALLNEERAIVSETAGTTRDVIEDQLVVDGIPFRIMDTAGIRHSDDEIERAGIERTYDRVGKGTLVVYLFDLMLATAADVVEDLQSLSALNNNILVVGNKADARRVALVDDLAAAGIHDVILISALTVSGIDQLLAAMVHKAVRNAGVAAGSVTVSNLRHFEALKLANEHLTAARNGLATGLSGEFVSFDLRRVLYHLGEITGEVTTDDLLGSIFSRFCIGK